MKDERVLDVAKNIQIYRRAKGYTREELAERVGVSPPTVYNWEAGRHEVKLHDLYTLMDVLEVDITDFFKYRGDE